MIKYRQLITNQLQLTAFSLDIEMSLLQGNFDFETMLKKLLWIKYDY